MSSIGDEGLAFYVFPMIENGTAFKNEYRSKLNQLNVTLNQVDRIVDEANMAFILNMRLFSEIDIQSGDATELIPFPTHDDAKPRQDDGKATECPFLARPGPDASAKAPASSASSASGESLYCGGRQGNPNHDLGCSRPWCGGVIVGAGGRGHVRIATPRVSR